MNAINEFLGEHVHRSRRFFLRAGIAVPAAAALAARIGRGDDDRPELRAALAKLESYLTPQDDFRDVSRGKPLPHALSDEAKQAAGLTRETWSLEVVSDPEHPADLKRPLTTENGTAFDFAALMTLAKDHAVSFAKVMTCNNIGCPLGMGIWEGVPLRELVWLTQPRRDVRRVFYKGFHNNQPSQEFRSSLPIGRVLEDPFGLPPVILCYKLNGEWLNSQRGGPVRIVVPEAYGFKSVKWLTRLTLTNLWHANDTYANGNNDIDSWLKTFWVHLEFGAVPRMGRCRVIRKGLTRRGIRNVGPCGWPKCIGRFCFRGCRRANIHFAAGRSTRTGRPSRCPVRLTSRAATRLNKFLWRWNHNKVMAYYPNCALNSPVKCR